MKQSFLLLVFLFCCATLSAQTVLLEGIVKDSVTGNPVPYVSISVSGSRVQTISNEEGAFVVKVTSLPVVLQLYSIGYEQKLIPVKDGLAEVQMKPLPVQLAEIVIKPGEAERIFQRAYGRLRKQKEVNYPVKWFYRLLSKNDDRYTELIEGFYKGIMGKAGIKRSELEHGRYALVKDYAVSRLVISADFSQLSHNLDLFNEHQTGINFPLLPFTPGANKIFRFRIGERRQTGSNMIVKIDYESRREEEGKYFNGSVYIDENDHRIYRIEARINNAEKKPFFILNKEAEIRNCALGYDIRFREHDGKMLIHTITMSTYYDQAEKGTGKLIHHVNTYSRLVCFYYDHKGVKLPGLQDDYETDYDMVRHRLYIKQFWDENPMLAETPLEKKVRADFERKGSFGFVFNPADDSMAVVNEGYRFWKNTRSIALDEITNRRDPEMRAELTEIRRNGLPAGGLYGELYFAWNCSYDTLLYRLFALMDMRATWVSDSIMQSAYDDIPYTEFVYQHYFNLVEVYRRKMRKALSEEKSWCDKRPELMKLYQRINNEWYMEEIGFLKRAWSDEGERSILGLSREIERRLADLEAYR